MVCLTEPETPPITGEKFPAMKLVPLMTSDAAAGKELTDAGLMLQLFAPNVAGQLRLTVPLNPSCAAMEIGALVPALPALTSGKTDGCASTKSGLVVTFSVN